MIKNNQKFNEVKKIICCHSINLPLEEQYGENQGWEESTQRFEIDSNFQDLDYFTSMDGNDLIKLIRKMENFLRERGISIYFFRNYGLIDQVFREMK